MEPNFFERVWILVRQIPPGKVASYGQISKIIGGCSARMVGYAMSALKSTKEMEDVPWQRVINSQGKCSTFGDGIGESIQRKLLLEEGVEFDDQGRVFRHDQWWVERPF